MKKSECRKESPIFKKLEKWRMKKNKNGKCSWLHKFADWLNEWHITRILAAFSSLTIILVIYVQYKQFVMWNEESLARKEERESRALQMIATKAAGDSGKRWALEFLNKQHRELNNINVSVDFHEGKVILNNIELKNSHIEDSNFSGVIANRSDFSNSKANGINFENSELDNSIFINSDLRNSNFSDANILNASFEGTDLTFADFSAANLNGSNLKKSLLMHTNFKATTLSNIDFSEATVWEIKVDGNTNITNANFSTIVFPKGIGNDSTEPTPLQEAIALCDKLKSLDGAKTAKLPERLVLGFKCTY